MTNLNQDSAGKEAEGPETETETPSPASPPTPPAGWTEPEREALLEAVDNSPYSLGDWLEAIAAFETWLKGRGERRRPWRDIVGYIHCCTLMESPGIPLGKLNIIVNQALIEFGFEILDDSQD